MPNAPQRAHRKVSETFAGKKRYANMELAEQGMPPDVCGDNCLVHNLMKS
jgi:hypothetical protein